MDGIADNPDDPIDQLSNGAAVRRVVVTLLAFFMLMPNGICTCANAACGPDAKAGSGTHAGPCGYGCNCQSRSKCAAASDASHCPTTNAAPGEAPHKHVPSCPACLGSMPSKFVSTQTAPCDAAPDVETAEVLVSLPSGAPLDRHAEVQIVKTRPLFVCHCAFLL